MTAAADRKKATLSAGILAAIRNRKTRNTMVSVPSDVPEAGALVASYNVHKCVGTDGRFDPERISRVIQEIGADIIALQEADKRFGERTGLLDLARLERETGLVPVPVSGRAKAHGWHGNVLLFRRASVREVHQIALPGFEPRGAVVAELDFETGASLRVVGAHFGLLRQSRARQARAIADLLDGSDDRPTLVMGDLNEWRLGRGSALNGFGTAFGTLPSPVASFPSRLPVLALDRIIGSRPGMVSTVQVHDTPLARIASDHLPIKAVIALDGA